MTMQHAPMGWNSWDCYGAAVTEKVVLQNARYMADHLKPFGWEYVVVDIQWSEPGANGHMYRPFAVLEMDDFSRLMPAVNRFPSAAGGKGFAPLADEIHRMGLKFGIHIMRGIPRQAVHLNTKILGTDRTAGEIADISSVCSWNTDMYGVDPKKEGALEYYNSLFSLYASWGVDFIKLDDICRELPHAEEELLLISRAHKTCGRKMLLSLSPGPALPEKAKLFKNTACMWRITDDFWDDWKLLYDMFDRAKTWCHHAGNGHWPDADMLPIGPLRQKDDPSEWTRFTEEEQITMMSLWCIMRSPLMIGGEMTGFDSFSLQLVTNREILRMHRLARYSHPVWRKKVQGTELVLWTAHCAEGGTYAALFNIGEEVLTTSLSFSDLRLEGNLLCQDLWKNTVFHSSGFLSITLKKHEAAVFLLQRLD